MDQWICVSMDLWSYGRCVPRSKKRRGDRLSENSSCSCGEKRTRASSLRRAAAAVAAGYPEVAGLSGGKLRGEDLLSFRSVYVFISLSLSVASLSLGYRSEDAHRPTARQAGLSSPARRRKVCWFVCLFVCLPCVVVMKEPLWLCSGNASCGAWALDGPTNQPTNQPFIRSFLTTVRASWKMRARGAPRNSRGRLRPLPHTFHTVEGDSECLTQRLASSAGSLASFSTSPPLKAVGPCLARARAHRERRTTGRTKSGCWHLQDTN